MRWTLLFICLFGLMQSGCRQEPADPVVLTDGRLPIKDTELSTGLGSTEIQSIPAPPAAEIDPRLPVYLDLPPTPLREPWVAGAKSLQVREVLPTSCSNPPPDACRAGRDWAIERLTRSLQKQSCECGVLKAQRKQVTVKDFQKLEAAILALTLAPSPVPPCAPTAPQVQIELLTVQGETQVYAVNYGQCGQNSLAASISVQSFEVLMKELSSMFSDP